MAKDMRENWEHEQDFKEAVNDVMWKKDLYAGDSFSIVDTFPGEKGNDGGEYGFYSHYTKTDVPGVYKLETSTTCDFDDCGTGYEGFFVLTNYDVRKMFKDEEIRKENYIEHGYKYVPNIIEDEYSYNFKDMVKQAERKGDLYTGDSFDAVVGFLRGKRVSANYTKTDVPGVYKYKKSGSLDTRGIKTYTVLTNERVKNILERERELKGRCVDRNKRDESLER